MCLAFVLYSFGNGFSCLRPKPTHFDLYSYGSAPAVYTGTDPNRNNLESDLKLDQIVDPYQYGSVSSSINEKPN